MSKEDKILSKKFIAFLQTQYPLKDDVKVTFLGEKNGGMSTGSRTMDSELKILSKGRLNRDVLRTLAHEWVHEYQHQKMGVKDTDKIQDIGGPEENMSNVLSGIFIKQFQKFWCFN